MSHKKKLVIASGVFDLIHYGHIKFLESAKSKGGPDAELIVVVARDSTAKRLKGQHTILPEEERRAIVESLKPVDKAILGYEGLDVPAIIENYKPDIIAVGYDQSRIEEMVKHYVDAHGKNIQVIKVEKFGREDLDSSTKIKRKIADRMK